MLVQPACHPPSERQTGCSAPRTVLDHSGVASVALLALLPPPPERAVSPKESGKLRLRPRHRSQPLPLNECTIRIMAVSYQPHLYLAAQGQHVVLVAAARLRVVVITTGMLQRIARRLDAPQ